MIRFEIVPKNQIQKLSTELDGCYRLVDDQNCSLTVGVNEKVIQKSTPKVTHRCFWKPGL